MAPIESQNMVSHQAADCYVCEKRALIATAIDLPYSDFVAHFGPKMFLITVHSDTIRLP